MSFMYNPFPFDDPNAVNRPELSEKITAPIISGTHKAASYLAAELAAKAKKGRNVIVAMDGYISAEWKQTVNIIAQQLKLQSVALETVDMTDIYKSSEELNGMFDPLLEWDTEKDPTLLFGRIYEGSYLDIFDQAAYAGLRKRLEMEKKGTGGKVVIVYGNGCAVKELRSYYDMICFFDVTPKETILRARRGQLANLGDRLPRLVPQVIRRCYYVDFELALHIRGELLQENLIDYYVAADHPEDFTLVPAASLYGIFAELVKYPMRAKPVYLEGIWGGTYVKQLRNLPNEMRNCAWVFDLIPMEVSMVVETGDSTLEFPFFTFIQKEGVSLMGKQCVEKFGGYFPIRFNYDDTYHSSGNMSIQVHSDHEYNRSNFNEFGRQDESYYVVATGHDARTYVGFRDGADTHQFIKEIKRADTEFVPVDYEKYIHWENSKPGLQVMIPAGTIHSSGRNQVVLEIGSLTIGSYTYKLYDYLRADLGSDKPRPIHTWHGERTLAYERDASWVRKNLVHEPRLVRKGEGWAEYIVGESDLLYFSLRRLEFEKSIEDNTDGRFHVLTLVDGEQVRIRSIDHPERAYIQNFMDMVIVPADMGRYVIENLRTEPICIHKTLLKDEFSNEKP